MSTKIALRITPTRYPGTFFISEQIKAAGIWGNTKEPATRNMPVYINETTTVFELMAVLEKAKGTVL